MSKKYLYLLFVLFASLHGDAMEEEDAEPPTVEEVEAVHETAEEPEPEVKPEVETEVIEQEAEAETQFEPFTGKISRNRVRMRLNPHMESPIVHEFNRGDLVRIIDEHDNFYVAEPLPGMHAYIYRPYVIDGVVEGTHVNIRLAPSMDAPVVTQMNTGDKIEEIAQTDDHRWYEIALPPFAHFYIHRDFIENIGAPTLFDHLTQAGQEANEKLASLCEKAEQQLSRAFGEIDREGTVSGFQQIIRDYPECQEVITQAKERLSRFEENYLQKKVAYLEEKSNRAYASRPEVSEEPEQSEWERRETNLLNAWTAMHPGGTLEQFYQEEKKRGTTLEGVIKPFSTTARNRPGEYILFSKGTNHPLAYVYSTSLPLERMVDKEVVLIGIPRQNFHYALPAYFALETL
ncbi:MAG: hypothetical protein KDK65_01140 [Chlamydiia bacterium]|nr:hypothetical protein [Chlamydiia bacterium]